MSEAKIPKGFVLLTSAFDGRKMLFPAARIVVSEVESSIRNGYKHASNCVVDSMDANVDAMGYRPVEPFIEVQTAMVRALGAQE